MMSSAAPAFVRRSMRHQVYLDDLATRSGDPDALPQGAHYWQVAARDIAGNWGDFSAPFTFSVNIQPDRALSRIRCGRFAGSPVSVRVGNKRRDQLDMAAMAYQSRVLGSG
ncbi:MAG: hypothetical protein H6672_02305 [Anaerolineaceae bacterium]|nr:hypothetical protein [Anaerolineaceae bacterium]